MSIEVMTRVWAESEQKGSSLLLLLALADHADDNGFCFPGVDTLAQKIRMTSQSVYNLTKALIEAGELVKISRQEMGRSNTYIVMTGISVDEVKAAAKKVNSFGGGKIFLPPQALDILGGDKIAALRGDKIAILEGDKEAVLPEPSVKPSSKPPINPKSPSATEEPETTTPTTFQGWTSCLQEPGANKPALVRAMYETLYPDRAPPDYGYCGKVARRMGGYEVLMMRLWEWSVRPPVGDVLAFIQGIKRNNGKNNDTLAQADAYREKLRAAKERAPTVEAEYVVVGEAL